MIRGLAILGILAVNADGFAVPMFAALNPATWPFPNEGATAISFWVMDAFFHHKFLTLFGMLFGVSLFLVGGEWSDKARSRLLWRRLAALLALGLLHGFGVWWGDILSLYAVTGLIMLFFRSLGPRTLLVIGVALYAFIALKGLDPAILPNAEPEARAAATASLVPPEGQIKALRAMAETETAEAKASWAGAYRVNTGEYLRLLSGNPFLIAPTLALMMIGLSLFKSGFLAGRSSTWRYGAMILAGVPALAAGAWLSWRTYIEGAPVLGGDTAVELLAPVIALAYASVLILIVKAGARLRPLAAAGRMAFTNYLTQSLIMTSIFYGGRGGLMGEVDRPVLWGMVFAVWVLQLIWSPLWLSRFEMGPFEWLWRCMTHGQWVPLVKQNPPATA
ncbi:DUF418 domain-containing protein [Brevundimonas sp. Root1423]|uniref:DUF418 domain-containing protein n=1 Tax=Brevundimonas sp. Root1423 TaxID=1736462 RepID=UPI00138F82CD|nr:DUF418 domain-containing protein [Brevundimonas sp. Root1423]